MSALGFGRGFGVLVAALVLSGCELGSEGPDGPSGPTAPGSGISTCDYAGEPEPKPHPENRVRVSGGATCREASELFFHPAPNPKGEGGAISPKPLPGWVCRRESRGRYGPVAFDCAKGTQRVRYLFH